MPKQTLTGPHLGSDGPAAKRSPIPFRIPKSLDILDQLWSVEVCPPWSCNEIGDCNDRLRRIRIAEELAPATKIDVFIHELLHAMLQASGCRVDPEAEETIVSCLAPMIWDTFRRNKIKLC